MCASSDMYIVLGAYLQFLEGGKADTMQEPDAELDTCQVLLNKKKV